MQIVEARSFFESSVENLESIKVKNGRQFLRHSIDKYIFWDEAYFRYIDTLTTIIIPIYYESDLYIKKLDDRIDLSSLSYAIFYQDKNSKWHAETVITLPDEQFLTDSLENPPFTGLVIVEDWQGGFLKGFSYNNSEVRDFSLKQDQTKRMSNENCLVTENYDCYSYNDGMTWHCSLMSIDKYCNSGSGGLATNYIYRPSTGGDNNNNNELPEDPIDPLKWDTKNAEAKNITPCSDLNGITRKKWFDISNGDRISTLIDAMRYENKVWENNGYIDLNKIFNFGDMGTDNYAPTFAGSIIINGTTLDIVISMSIMGNDTAYIEGEGYDLPKANANIHGYHKTGYWRGYRYSSKDSFSGGAKSFDLQVKLGETTNDLANADIFLNALNECIN